MSNFELLNQFIGNISYNNIPITAVKSAKMSFLDFIGVSIGGRKTMASRIALQFAQNWGRGPATIIGINGKWSIYGATWANAISACSLDFEDGHDLSGGHPASCIMPALLAVAEKEKKSGKDLLEAIIASYEISIRTAACRKHGYRFSHATGTWGSLGAAVAASKILDLKNDQLANALGIAISHSVARPQVKDFVYVPMIKECIGWASLVGISAAHLAQLGFTACTDFFEYDELFETKKLFKTLGSKYLITETYLKPYSSCRWTHAIIDATAKIVKDNILNHKDIKEIIVRSFQLTQYMSSQIPRTTETAQYSIPYCIALVILGKKVEPKEFLFKDGISKELLDISKKVRIIPDSKYENVFPSKKSASVEIVTSQRRFFCEVEQPLGSWQNPMSQKEIKDKFEMLLVDYSFKKVKEIWYLVENLEEVEDINKLTRLLRKVK